MQPSSKNNKIADKILSRKGCKYDKKCDESMR